MMNNYKSLLFFVAIINLSACSDQKSNEELEITKQELRLKIEENAKLQDQLNIKEAHAGDLVHYVFLDVKDDISEKQYQFLMKEIKSLSKIDEVSDLKVGRNENMDDDRALVNRDINFEMRFDQKTDYYAYQKSKEHMRVRELLSPFLAQPPLTYDYIIQ